MASSRVGTSTSARGRRGAEFGASAASRVTVGRPKASVLPDPVRPRPSTSRPMRPSGIAAAWMGNGSVMPSRASRSTSRSGRPSAANALSGATSTGPVLTGRRVDLVHESAASRSASGSMPAGVRPGTWPRDGCGWYAARSRWAGRRRSLSRAGAVVTGRAVRARDVAVTPGGIGPAAVAARAVGAFRAVGALGTVGTVRTRGVLAASRTVGRRRDARVGRRGRCAPGAVPVGALGTGRPLVPVGALGSGRSLVAVGALRAVGPEARSERTGRSGRPGRSARTGRLGGRGDRDARRGRDGRSATRRALAGGRLLGGGPAGLLGRAGGRSAWCGHGWFSSFDVGAQG